MNEICIWIRYSDITDPILVVTDEDFEILPAEDHYWNRSTFDSLQRNLHCSNAELREILKREESRPAFDALQVRNLLREEHSAQRKPYLLVLGQLEMTSFQNFVYRGFGEESGSGMRELYFLGIRVVQDASLSRLEFISNPKDKKWGSYDTPSAESVAI